MVTSLPQISASSAVCEECVVSEQHRNQFPQGKSWRAKPALELVHSNVCGPITPCSNGDQIWKWSKNVVGEQIPTSFDGEDGDGANQPQ
ncbi:hypothetical protein MRB53_003153 [Persea americana]|uniref:Uncharacterized protein n=1 Tax=Persea americana TaxID=3435 RepID=A0ACC2MWV2_PERAE|nr:hypothetical protein MRB53_003153 [Persea americana]